MWHKSFSVETDEVSKEQIWKVLTDLQNWNKWDADIEWTKCDEQAKLGTEFFLKPKGGPKVRLTVSQFDKPNVFADVSHLPLAKMHTIKTLTHTPAGVKIQMDVKVEGLLSFLWSRVIAQNQIDGGVEQTQLLINHAKTISE